MKSASFVPAAFFGGREGPAAVGHRGKYAKGTPAGLNNVDMRLATNSLATQWSRVLNFESGHVAAHHISPA
jgi:hypothetical protein